MEIIYYSTDERNYGREKIIFTLFPLFLFLPEKTETSKNSLRMKKFYPKNLFFISYFLFLISSSFSQDIHFSQFYASPLTLNPAETGNYHGDWRLMNNFRSQWKAIGIPFRTISLGYDRQIFIGKERLSGGIILVNDQSGDEKLIVNKFFLSTAYHKTLGKSTFHLGIQGGYVMKSYNTSKMTFPNQFDKSKGEFINSLPNNEKTLGDQSSYVDLNGGIIWTGNFGKFQPEIGFSVFHLTQPKETFIGKNNKLPMRNVIHYGGKIDLNDKLFLMPNIFYMNHSSANDLLAGSNIGIKLKENGPKIKSVFFGPLFRSGISRNSDAFIAIFGVNFLQLDLGISYDVNISTLKSSTRNRGAFEFSLIYTGMTTRVAKITTPCDRY